jgi:hypothetical protein
VAHPREKAVPKRSLVIKNSPRGTTIQFRHLQSTVKGESDGASENHLNRPDDGRKRPGPTMSKRLDETFQSSGCCERLNAREGTAFLPTVEFLASGWKESTIRSSGFSVGSGTRDRGPCSCLHVQISLPQAIHSPRSPSGPSSGNISFCLSGFSLDVGRAVFREFSA